MRDESRLIFYQADLMYSIPACRNELLKLILMKYEKGIWSVALEVEVDVFGSDPQQEQQEQVDTHSDGLKQEPMARQHVTH